jgi:Kelch motif
MGAASSGAAGTGGKAGATGTGGSGGGGGAPISCTVGTSCPSGFCNTTTQKCVASQCQDGVKNGAETDIDCGGSTCPKCDVNKVCGVNGDCKTGSCSRLFCALVSGPPNWLPGPSLNYGRGFVAAGIALGNGQETLFVTGGRDDSDDSDPALSSYEELYTGGPSFWAPYTDGMGAFGATATDAAGDLLIFAEQSTWSLSVPHVWKMLSTLTPTPRSGAAAALAPNGLVYVIGGDNNGVIEAYDPVMNKWTTGLSPMPTPRSALAAALGTDGLIYAIAGDNNVGRVGTVEAYDTSTNTWSTKSALPANEDLLSAVSGPDGRIYALGGPSATVNAYSPATNRWAPVVSLSDNRDGVGAVVTPDGHIWAIGGTINPESAGETTVQIYGPNATVNPQAGAPGTSIAVSGSNFAANATVSVYLGSAMSAPLGTGTTNATGALTTPISATVPSLAAGNQPLIVIDDRSQYPITLEFRVQ